MDWEKKMDRVAANLEAAKTKAAPYTLGKIIFHRIKSGDNALRDHLLTLVRGVEPCKEFSASAVEDLITILEHDIKEDA